MNNETVGNLLLFENSEKTSTTPYVGPSQEKTKEIVSKQLHSPFRKELDRRLIEEMTLGVNETQLDDEYQYKIEDVLYGYKSVTSTSALFDAIVKVFDKASTLPDGKSKQYHCLHLTQEWIKCGLYRQDYKIAAKSINKLIAFTNRGKNQKMCCEGELLLRLWTAAQQKPMVKAMPLAPSGAIECQNMQDLIWRCHHKPRNVAHVLRVFFTKILLNLKVNDLLEPDKIPSTQMRRSAKEENTLSIVASSSDQVTYQIMYDLLSKESRYEAEKRFEFYLQVASNSIITHDTTSAMAIYAALCNLSIERLKLMGKRPQYRGIKEQIGFNDKKRTLKCAYDKKVTLLKGLNIDCSCSRSFRILRNIERQDYTTPHLTTILTADLIHIKDLPETSCSSEENIARYSIQRIRMCAKIIKEFCLNQQAMRESTLMSNLSIERFIDQSNITEEQLSQYSHQIKPEKHIYEQWYSYCSPTGRLTVASSHLL